MMDPGDLASKCALWALDAASQPLLETGVPTFPSAGDVVQDFSDSLAMHQYQFQQSLTNQQLTAHHQAAAHAVKIKATAERAAAHAAEISNLFKIENDVPDLPLTGDVLSSFNDTIAMQQYQFQQSLMNQQLTAQQQSAAHAVKIKAIAERAAARAAEVSNLFKTEDSVADEKSEDSVAEREKLELKSRLESASPNRDSKSNSISPAREDTVLPPPHSKSNSISPIKCRSVREEGKEHSPRECKNYLSSRNSRRRDDLRDYSRSSHRRGADSSDGRSNVSYNRTSRSRRPSPLYRSMRHSHDNSRSPRHRDNSYSRRRNDDTFSHHAHDNESPSLILECRASPEIVNRSCSLSKNPVGRSRSSPRHSRKSSPRKAIARKNSSSPENSPIRRTINSGSSRHVRKSSPTKAVVAKSISSGNSPICEVDNGMKNNENHNASNRRARWQEREARPTRGKLITGRSGSPEQGQFDVEDYVCASKYRNSKMHASKESPRKTSELNRHEQELRQKAISSKGDNSANIQYAIYPLSEGHETTDMKLADVNSSGVMPNEDKKIDAEHISTSILDVYRSPEKRSSRRSISRERRQKHRKEHHKKDREESDDRSESHEKRRKKHHKEHYKKDREEFDDRRESHEKMRQKDHKEHYKKDREESDDRGESHEKRKSSSHKAKDRNLNHKDHKVRN